MDLFPGADCTACSGSCGADFSRAPWGVIVSKIMSTRTDQIAFRHRAFDGAKGVPQYEADGGPLTAAQVRQIKKRVPQHIKRSVRSSLLEV